MCRVGFRVGFEVQGGVRKFGSVLKFRVGCGKLETLGEKFRVGVSMWDVQCGMFKVGSSGGGGGGVEVQMLRFRGGSLRFETLGLKLSGRLRSGRFRVRCSGDQP